MEERRARVAMMAVRAETNTTIPAQALRLGSRKLTVLECYACQDPVPDRDGVHT